MDANPWVDRILETLQREQATNSSSQLSGIEEWQLMMLLGVEAGDENWFAFQAALSYLKDVDLACETTWDGIALTDQGWLKTLGTIPGTEKVGPFWKALVKAWQDRPDPGAWVSGMSLFDVLGWERKPEDLILITQRLKAKGWIDVIGGNGPDGYDEDLALTYEGTLAPDTW